MQLHNILANLSFCCGLLGVGGMAGAIEHGAGYITSSVLLLICMITGYLAYKESGVNKSP